MSAVWSTRGQIKAEAAWDGWVVREDHLDDRSRYAMVVTPAIARARASASGMGIIENLIDADIGEVKSSAETSAGVEEATAELRAFSISTRRRAGSSRLTRPNNWAANSVVSQFEILKN